MHRKEYILNEEISKKSEKTIRKFLLKTCDAVLLTKISPISIGPITIIKNNKKGVEKYMLSKELKIKINKEGLFFNYPNSKLFINLEDPVFYKKEEIVAKEITHESMIILYLTDKEKKILENEIHLE